ncbi:MAG: ABC transporter permease subunit [Candidatus Limnocylindria bacterium]
MSEHARPLRERLAEHGIDRVLWLVLPAAALLGMLFVYPFVYGLGLSVQPNEGAPVIGNYVRFFSDDFERSTIWKTLVLAIPAAVVNVGISIPIAYKMRGPVRNKRLITTLLVMPATLGTVLVAEGLIRYFGPIGWFNQFLMAIGLIDGPLRLTHNYVGVMASLIITGFPLSLLLVLGHASGIDPDLERAAATLGAGPSERFRRVVLPLMLPGITIAFILAFVAAFSVFPSAVMVGNPAGETRVISIAAYQAAFERFDYPMASAIAMIMAAVQFAIVAFVFLLRGRLYRGSTSGGKG